MNEIEKLIKKLLSLEFIRYILGGGFTTFLNFAIYYLLLYCGVVYHLANLIAIINVKIYSYFVNKFFVYRSKNNHFKETAIESFKYFLSRAFTGIVDYLLVILLVEILDCNKVAVKIIVLIIVIILNYVLGKVYVFKHKNK